MKTSTMIIVGAAAVGAFMLVRSGKTLAAGNKSVGAANTNRVTSDLPVIKFANAAQQFFADPVKYIGSVDYYNANPNATAQQTFYDKYLRVL